MLQGWLVKSVNHRSLFPGEKKISALVDQYEQLKKDGKLPKYLEKKRKKQIHKQRRYFEHDLPE